ncbi:hypothetical protein RchiOBHm_Chr5g0075011 [Rosa chinensis]|uniref:Uncharacterized protein n=1 Tax=Rosa chinensis TaxID=74649 RepID=A0A2P6QLB7_ROSCH|nr:hypothetical protein RchiOBHm_Chr5g0075011 [Rosa chinensis]
MIHCFGISSLALMTSFTDFLLCSPSPDSLMFLLLMFIVAWIYLLKNGRIRNVLFQDLICRWEGN